MKLFYECLLRDEDTGELITKISAYSLESLEEDLGKIEAAAKRAEEENKLEEKVVEVERDGM